MKMFREFKDAEGTLSLSFPAMSPQLTSHLLSSQKIPKLKRIWPSIALPSLDAEPQRPL